MSTETFNPSSIEKANETAPRYYVRFSLPQRYLHAIIGITFLGLAFTGLPLRFSYASWAAAVSNAVGGFGAIIFFHKLCAFIMTIAFLTHVGNIAFRVVARREFGLLWGLNSMVPNWKDVKDFFGNLRWFVGLGRQPKFDRYAYWEKFDYWAVFWGMGIIGFSGYAMWFAPFFARFIPGSWLNIALVIHGEEAILAVGFIFAIHFFNTHLRPDNFPMDLTIFTGRETERELKHRHPEEYQRLAASGELKQIQAPTPPLWLKNFGLVTGSLAVLAGVIMLVMMAIAF